MVISKSCLARGLIALSLGAFAGIGHAQVIEIAESGTVTYHDGPALYQGNAATPQPLQAKPTSPIVFASSRPTAPIRPAGTIANALLTSAAQHGVSPDLALAIAWHESRLRPDAVSSKGAIGVMQLMPAVARQLRVDPHDPAANIEGGVTLISDLLRRFNGDLIKTLAAYDAGPAAVARYNGVPPYAETRAYVADIMEGLARMTDLRGK